MTEYKQVNLNLEAFRLLEWAKINTNSRSFSETIIRLNKYLQKGVSSIAFFDKPSHLTELESIELMIHEKEGQAQ